MRRARCSPPARKNSRHAGSNRPPRWSSRCCPPETSSLVRPPTESGHQEDEALYPVHVARPLYMAHARGHARAMGHGDGRRGGSQPRSLTAILPVVNITWNDARQFLDRLNHAQAWRFRLPSEVEWEYACRAGTTTPYSTGDAALDERGELQRRVSAAWSIQWRESRPRDAGRIVCRRIRGASSTCTATCGSGPTTPMTRSAR